MDEAFQLDEAEYLKLMSEMEQSFLAALLRDEAAFLTRLEAEDARDLDSLVSHCMHMHLLTQLMNALGDGSQFSPVSLGDRLPAVHHVMSC